MTVLDRSEYATARPRDVALLKVLFAEGRHLTKADVAVRWAIPNRRFRAAVSELRRQGTPIVAFSERGSTYHLATSEDELEQFIKAEVLSRATDLFAQAAAMRREARTWFAPIQPELISVGASWWVGED